MTEEIRLRPEKSEVNRLLGCNKKAKRLCGWEPQYTLEEGLAETIAWMRKNMYRYRPDEYHV